MLNNREPSREAAGPGRPPSQFVKSMLTARIPAALHDALYDCYRLEGLPDVTAAATEALTRYVAEIFKKHRRVIPKF